MLGCVRPARWFVENRLETRFAVMPDVNPKMLVWAREAAGLSCEEAAKKLGFKDTQKKTAIEKLADLEKGKIAPTHAQLFKMAEQYRQPLVVFYLSEPPAKEDYGEDYRRLPTTVTSQDNAQIDAIRRNIKTRQGLVKDLLESEEETKPLDFVGSVSIEDEIPNIVDRIQRETGFVLSEYRQKKGIKEAISYLRQKIESIGVFVIFISDLGSHHSKISVDMFRGFALADKIAPFIVVNGNDSPTAQAFTMLHELVHIWIGSTGISNRSFENKVEKFCNDVAGEILLPQVEMQNRTFETGKSLISVIEQFAESRNISKTMVSYKLYRLSRISFAQYEELSEHFFKQYASSKDSNDSKGGPSYYTVKKYRAGNALVSLVDRMLAAREITSIKAGKILDVKGQNVHKVFEALGKQQKAA